MAIHETGTFDAAARTLGISTSAVSQRVRALESSLGRVLIRRTTPCTLTTDGAAVLRHARAQQLLVAELGEELGLTPASSSGTKEPEVPAAWHPRTRVRVAVNADSLATWFAPIVAASTSWEIGLELVVADEARTASLLRDGRVMCAVSSSPDRISGCRVMELGAITYAPMVATDLLAQVPAGCSPAAALPMLAFDADDDLQHLALREASLEPDAPRAMIPSPAAFHAAVVSGLGWGMIPQADVAAHPGLVAVPGLAPVSRQLFWHRWSLRSASLDLLTDAVTAALPATGTRRR